MSNKILLSIVSAICLITTLMGQPSSIALADTFESKVFVQVESSFEASIPRDIELYIHSNADGTGTAEYRTSASGDTEGDMSVYIIPDESFTLTEVNTGEQIEVSIIQSKTEWSSSDLMSNILVDGYGYVVVTGLKPGVWRGAFDFEISKEESTASKYVPGLYADANYKTLLKSWDDLLSEGVIKVTDGAAEALEDSINGYLAIGPEVTSISDNGFCAVSGLTGIYLPDSVTTLGRLAVGQCEDLVDVRLSQSLTTLGVGAFAYCPNLTELILPDSLQTISTQIIYGTGIKSIVVPANATVASLAFTMDSTDVLESILVNSNNTKYSSLDGVLYTKDLSTLVCFPIAKVVDIYTVPDETEYIGEYAFGYAKGVKRIIVPDGFKEYQNLSLMDSSIEYFNIPAGATVYSNYFPQVLSDSKNVKYVDIDDNNSTFKDIDGVVYSKDGKTIHYYPPNKDGEVFAIPSGVAAVNMGCFTQNRNLKELSVPEGVTSFGAFAAAGSNIEEIKIPSTLKQYTMYALAGASKLSSITFPNGHSSWYVQNGALYSNAKNLLTHLHGLPDTTFTTNSTCTRIADGAFQGSVHLVEATITDNVTTLGTQMFGECNELTTVHLSNKVTSIPNYVFMYCTKLTNIEIPSSVTTIGDRVFYMCTSLDLNVPSTVTKIGSGAFYRVPHITYSGSATGSPWGASSIN